jgi:D-alanyl-D-alanine carboxypeptidase (penicillin-binding protein 5/6)
MQTSARSRALAVTVVITAFATSGMAITPVPKNEVGGPQLASHGVVVHYSPGGRPLPSVPASAYVIADASTGSVLAAKDAHGLFPPASTLKVLTAITMLPRLRPNATVLATKRATSVEPNIVGLVAGHRYKVADLFHALLLISANDAAVALVEASGSFSKGMALLNAEAHHLQAYDVVAKQPNGLPAKGQVVSAYDLALIARAALAMPAFMKYDSMRTARFPVKRHKHVLLVNQNYLITKYKGGLGGKIGWTLKAGATYIGMARRDGVTLIVTILHARPLTEIASAEKLLNWGFANAAHVGRVGVLVPPLAAARPAAAQTKSAPAAESSLAAASAGSGDAAAIGAGVAAGVCACVLGGLAWLRRRALLGRRRSG